jgi:hypothetical protein
MILTYCPERPAYREWLHKPRQVALQCHWVEVDWGRNEHDAWMANGARATEQANTLETTFKELAERWKAETQFLSSTSKAVMHPAYQRIIGMGQTVVPLLLRQLEESPDHWFWALRSITGEDPVPPESAGHLRRMSEAWLRWGREHNFI